MSEKTKSNSEILARFLDRTTRSEARYKEAKTAIPSGIVHDARHMYPYPIYADRGQGSRKWDIDGNEYVDYYGGHGSMLLGHAHPDVVAAVKHQIERGTQLAACSELEVQWARMIQQMVPCAERVRFTSSGTEATHMAFRLARAFTGKSKIVRFRNHFHGWHDHVAFGVNDHMDGSPSSGVTSAVAAGIVLVDPNDTAAVARILDADKDIAAVIVEPIGASSGYIPMPRAVLAELREITRQRNVPLIFDEVVTAFRVSPGGLQALYGIVPELTTMAKIVSGGLPGGAVAGRKDILDWLDHDASKSAHREKISHQGTNNANLVSAAAGVATLGIVRTTKVCEKATATAAELRKAMNEVLEDEGVPWAVYGEHSFFNVFTNPVGADIKSTSFDASVAPLTWFKSDKREGLLSKLRLAMMINGVDLKSYRGGMVSAVHSKVDIADTVTAWRSSLRMLKAEGELGKDIG